MKKLFTILTLCLVMASTAHAQVFLTDGDYQKTRDSVNFTNYGIIPAHWVTDDQANDFVPVGEGILLLSSLAGAYLLRKKTQNNYTK